MIIFLNFGGVLRPISRENRLPEDEPYVSSYRNVMPKLGLILLKDRASLMKASSISKRNLNLALVQRITLIISLVG